MTGWLIDKSALIRIAASADTEPWISRIERGLVRITSLTRLEVGYSARSASDLREWEGRAPLADMPVQYMTPPAEDRAMSVQMSLAERGHHRAPSVADLLVAAVAEMAGLTLLHVDKDFELIAEITGQTTERLALA